MKAARTNRATGFVAVLLWFMACSGRGAEPDQTGGPGWTSGTDAGGAEPSSTGTGGSASEGDGDSGEIRLDLGDGGESDGVGPDGGNPGDCQNVSPPKPNAYLTGTVLTPNLQIPISGALVYTLAEEPAGVVDGVYCSECQGVPCDRHYVFASADGTFSLPAVAGDGQWLVVTKGEFMHVTQLDIVEGTTALDATTSSLPGEWNPAAGHYIPRMVVMETSHDQIYNVLAKIGLGEVDDNGELIRGTERFDILDAEQGRALLDTPGALDAYHLAFVPCMSQGGLGGDGTVPPGQQENVRRWVEAGGKWYVTDWANEYLYDVFAPYQTFNRPEDPDLGVFNSEGTVLDPDLLGWLQALPAGLKDIGNGYPTLANLPGITLEDNWSGLEDTPPVIVQNEDGEDVDVGHYPWVEGPCASCVSDPTSARPMTVSARYGCGRMLFSTYHTTESVHAGLTPQELVLLYIILEIGLCQEGSVDLPPVG